MRKCVRTWGKQLAYTFPCSVLRVSLPYAALASVAVAQNQAWIDQFDGAGKRTWIRQFGTINIDFATTRTARLQWRPMEQEVFT